MACTNVTGIGDERQFGLWGHGLVFVGIKIQTMFNFVVCADSCAFVEKSTMEIKTQVYGF